MALSECPGTRCCNTTIGHHGLEIPWGVAYVSILSSLFSCLASIIIVFTYAKWKDIRTGSRSVITYLAIADFFTAFGYVMGSINYLVASNKHDCTQFEDVCAIQSFITTWSSVSSFFWTVTLAFYLYLTLVHTRIFLANRLIPVFHIINWAFPIIFCLPLLIMGQLGYSPFAASTWCYIKEDQGSPGKKIGLILVAGKFWEILSYVLVIVLYAVIKIHIRRQTKIGEEKNYLSTGLVNAVRKADSKLVFIPMVFVLLRLWGTVQFFYLLGVPASTYKDGCTCIQGDGYYYGLIFFGVMQAIGDGGQGWGNFFLYILASAKIRNRLFGLLVECIPGRYPTAFEDPRTPINVRVQPPDVRPLTPRSSVNNGENSYQSDGLEPTTT